MAFSPTIVTAAVAGLPSVLAALFAYRSSSQANRVNAEAQRINERKVDAEAYDRSQAFYEKLLSEADRAVDRLRSQVDRLQEQLDRTNNQLSNEQDVSNALRNHVRSLQAQVNGMEVTVATLREQLNVNRGGDTPYLERARRTAERSGAILDDAERHRAGRERQVELDALHRRPAPPPEPGEQPMK